MVQKSSSKYVKQNGRTAREKKMIAEIIHTNAIGAIPEIQYTKNLCVFVFDRLDSFEARIRRHIN